MKFSRNTNYILLTLLVILNIVIRYPITSHMYGTDSFFILDLANSISISGYSKLILHPMSFFGVYPLSYGSMFLFLISGLSQSLDISGEYTILIIDIILSIFGLLSIFLIAKEIQNNDLFSFMVAFIFSLSPAFLFYTSWQGSTRGVFISVFPLLIYLLIKSYNSNRKIYYFFIMSFFYVFTLSIHRIALLSVITFAACIFAIITLFLKSKLSFFRKDSANIHKFYILLFIMMALFFMFYNSISEKFQSGDFESNYAIVNLIVSYFGRSGPILFFGFIGILSILFSKNTNFGKELILFNLIFSIPLLSERYYMPLYLLTIISLFIGFGIILTYNKLKIKLKYNIINIFICTIILTSLIFSGYMLGNWREIGTNLPMNDETDYIAFYTKNRINSTFITNDGWYGLQITSISGQAGFPLGGPSMFWNAPEQLIYGFINSSEIRIGEMVSFKEIVTQQPDVFYSYSGVPNIKEEYQEILYNKITDEKAKNNIIKYNIHYVYLVKQLGNYFMSYGKRDSDFIPSLRNQQNKIFDSKIFEIWYI